MSLSAQSPDASKCEVSKKTVRKVTISWLQEQLSLGLLKLRSIVAQIGGMFQTKREPPRLTSPKLSTSTTMKWSWSILLIKAICRVKDQWGDSQTCAFPMNTAVHRSFKNFICSYYIFVLSLSLSIYQSTIERAARKDKSYSPKLSGGTQDPQYAVDYMLGLAPQSMSCSCDKAQATRLDLRCHVVTLSAGQVLYDVSSFPICPLLPSYIQTSTEL